MTPTQSPADRAWRVRHTAVVLALSAAVFLQEPGRTAADTKLDLTQNPWGLLGRALHLWEPLGYVGQVQNQAYGYFFPMGPFFGLLSSAHVPAWVAQRLWWSVLLGLAYIGSVLLCRSLLRTSQTAALVAGLAYVLAPRFMTVMGPVSAEVVPMALAPWILLPLVRHQLLGTRRAAALSGVAVLGCGGVNAAAALAVLLLPLIFLLTRAAGPAKRRLLLAWLGCTALATLWWLVPLVVLGGVSPPFLDWIESASVTTAITSPATVLRGADHWVAYLAGLGGPEWRGGWALVAQPAFVLDTMVVAGLGLAGLAAPRCRERVFLLSAVVVGLGCVTLGHVGPVDGVGAEWFRTALDGSLAPFRNLHKFDPVLRLPLSLGVGVLVGQAVVTIGRGAPVRRVLAVGLVGVTVVGLLGSAAPLLTKQFIQRGSFAEVPGYWKDTADWLAVHADGRRSLLVPGASFSDSYWGRTKDDPLQVSGTVVWATRDAVPLAPAGTIRFLDAVQRRLASGTPSPGLADALARAGVGYVVVRNDLDYAVAGSPRPVLIHQALDGSPGLRRVQTFGPAFGGGSTPGALVDRELDRSYAAVEVYAVDRPVDRAVLVQADQVGSVAGGPESLLDLLDEGVRIPPAVVLTSDPAAQIVTDSPRRRDVSMGRVDDSASATLADGDATRKVPAPDYLSAWATPRLVPAVQDGARVSASTSVADAGVPGGSRPEHQAFAAVDGDPTTSWVSAPGAGAVGQWIDLAWDTPVDPSGTRVTFDPLLDGPRAVSLTVTTDAGSNQVDVPADAPAGWVLPVPVGPTASIRVVISAVSDGSAGFVAGLAELSVPGVTATRPVRAAAAGSSPSTVLLRAPLGWAAGCVHVGDRPLCSPSLPRPGEEDRGIDRLLGGIPAGPLSVRVVPNPSDALDAWVTEGAPVSVTGTSTAVRDPSGAPYTVLDGDLRTGWVAASTDPNPTLTFSYDAPRTVRSVDVVIDPGLAASRPGSVIISSAGGVRLADVNANGVAVLSSPLTGTTFDLAFRSVSSVQSYDPFQRRFENVPVGASEIRLEGAGAARSVAPDAQVVELACGTAPSVFVNGARVETRGSTTVGRLRALEPVDLQPCASVPASPVSTRLVAASVPGLRVDSVVIGRPASSAAPTAVAITAWQATSRTMQVATRLQSSWLVVRENANPGWQARLDGVPLKAAVVDGWEQAWVVPAGPAGVITVTYGPDTPYRRGLLAGLLAVIALLVLALLPVRGRRDLTALRAASPRWPVLVGLLLVAALVTLGPWGTLAAAVGWLAGAVGRRWWAWAPAALAAGLVSGSAVVLASGPWASSQPYQGNAALPQLLVAGAIGAAVSAGGSGVDATGVGTRWRRR